MAPPLDPPRALPHPGALLHLSVLGLITFRMAGSAPDRDRLAGLVVLWGWAVLVSRPDHPDGPAARTWALSALLGGLALHALAAPDLAYVAAALPGIYAVILAIRSTPPVRGA